MTVDVSTQVAATAPSNGGGDDPTLILIFGWLGAKNATLQKYGDGYKRIYPGSNQIIINADSLRYWKPKKLQERAIAPALRRLEELGALSITKPGLPPRVLCHVMSNGGVMSFVDLATALRKRNIPSPPDAKCAIIFDSSPAPPSFAMTIRAYTISMRSRFKKCLMAVALTSVYVLSFIARMLFRYPEPLAQALAELNDPGLLPWTSMRTKRMYFYSSADKIVPKRAIEEHAAAARSKGFEVEMVNFGDSDHVCHARDHPEKYWEAVRTFWSEAVKA